LRAARFFFAALSVELEATNLFERDDDRAFGGHSILLAGGTTTRRGGGGLAVVWGPELFSKL